MQYFKPAGRRPFQRATLETKLGFHLRRDKCAVARHIPVKYNIAGARQGQRFALLIRHRAHGQHTTGKGVLHHGETDQHDYQHKAADQRR